MSPRPEFWGAKAQGIHSVGGPVTAPVRLISISEAARRMGVSRPSLYRWARRGAPIPLGGEGVDLQALAQWKAEHDERGRPTGSIKTTGDDGEEDSPQTDPDPDGKVDQQRVAREARNEALQSADLRKRLADAEKKELELAERRGELISRVLVEEGNVRRVHAVKRAFACLPSQLVGLDERGIRDVLDAVLESFARGGVEERL